MSCCKVNTNNKPSEKESNNKIFSGVMIIIVAVIMFPILYIYVMYLLIKQLATGKTNKISDIANDLFSAVKAFKNFKPEDNPEYYDMLDDDLELESLIKDKDEEL